MEIKNKIVVITGGAGGIGLSIAKSLLQKGVKFIALFELDNPSTKNTFNDLEKKYGERVGFYPCDVTNNEKLAENFDKVIVTHKTIDILINNAGITNESAFERMMDINYKAVIIGSLMMIERVGKHKGGQGGVIVNIASVAGVMPLILPIYSSTKHGVVSFTQTMDEQFEITGVRVVAVCPGATDTPIIADISDGLEFIRSEGKADGIIIQSPNNVAVAVVKIIESGKSADVWVSEDNLPPYAVRAVKDHKSLRISE